MVDQRLPELLDELGVRLRKSGKKYVGQCPIHDGDSPWGFNLYRDGYALPIIWKCRSDTCNKVFYKSAVGFVRGVLSNQRYGWPRRDQTASTHEAVDFILDFLGITIDDVKVDRNRADRQQFTSQVEFWTRGSQEHKGLFTRNQFRKWMLIPSPYFLERGYSPSILDTYDVGTCTNPKSKMCGRAVVPIYDENGKGIGVVGRTTYQQCESCRLFHPDTSPCPPEEERNRYVRWRVSDKFNDKLHVYNSWRALPYIRESRTVIVCEGAGDVWRLEEAGIRNSIALFGSDLSDAQDSQIQRFMIDRIIVASDMDDGGDKLFDQIKRQCRTYINSISRVPLPKKDVGGMTVEEVQTTFGGKR